VSEAAMSTNPYQSPLDASAAPSRISASNRAWMAFIVTVACFYALNAVAFHLMRSRSEAELFLCVCLINVPAMPFFAAAVGCVEACLSPALKQAWKNEISIGLFAILIGIGPLLWGGFAAYLARRWGTTTKRTRDELPANITIPYGGWLVAAIVLAVAGMLAYLITRDPMARH
jgi:hypothetical protein